MARHWKGNHFKQDHWHDNHWLDTAILVFPEIVGFILYIEQLRAIQLQR